VVLSLDLLESGGSQRQAVELAARFQADPGWRCSVLVYVEAEFFAGRLREAGVPLVCLPKRSGLDPTYLLRLRRFLDRERPDVLHAFLLPPGLWGLLAARTLPRARRPLVVAGVRDSLVAPDTGSAWAQRVVYRGADAVTTNALPVVDLLRERIGVPAARVHYLPNGIDLARWDAQMREAAPLPLEPGRFHLALVGGLRREKAHAVLFAALERLGPERVRDWRVWCVGGPSGGPEMAREVERELRRRRLGDVVRLEPPVRNVAALMARLDALVLPSLHEAFPNAVLEAMAAGLPVVATRVGNVPHLVEDGREGLLVPPGDAAALADALARLAALPAECRRAMGRRGRAAVAARFEIGAVARAHLALYDALLRERSP
jgi:glycosyltransferase involved in cell wall biosynthesis